MNFSKAYEIIGEAADSLLKAVNEEIKKLNDEDFNYQDYDSKTKEKSWLRLDFMKRPEEEKLLPLYEAVKNLVNELAVRYSLDPVTSFSVSMLKPRQVLEEHTDGRFKHRITNRFIVPLSDSDKNYNYGYVNGEKVIYKLHLGKIYRINNAIIHSAVNEEDVERYNILIDTFEQRLQDKFKKFIDIMAPLSDEGFKFSQARHSDNKHDRILHKFANKHKTTL
jgi:hypothetical protein